MRKLALVGLALCVPGLAESQNPPDNRLVFGPANPNLAAGAIALQAGDYDEGIEQTLIGLQDRTIGDQNRAAGLSNLCAAYAAKQEPTTALRYCTESLALRPSNWRAYSNRSYVYWLMGRYDEAQADLNTAAGMNPRARQIAQIRGMINEMVLQPNIRMEDLQ